MISETRVRELAIQALQKRREDIEAEIAELSSTAGYSKEWCARMAQLEDGGDISVRPMPSKPNAKTPEWRAAQAARMRAYWRRKRAGKA